MSSSFVMALAHTIMSLLTNYPHSGYDLAKKFDGPVGCYWKASQQQVYRELGKLEQQGDVSFEAIPQEGRLDKKVYCLTEQGKKHLIEWLEQPSEPTPIREDLAVKLTAAHLVLPQILIKDIERRRQIHQANAEEIKITRDNYMTSPEGEQIPPEAIRFFKMKLDLGIRYEETWVAWCDETLEKLKNE